MGNGIYSAANGALVQSQYLDVIANNLANVSTVGYKADELQFGNYIAESMQAGQEGGILEMERPSAATNLARRNQNYVEVKGRHINFQDGNLKPTNNALDVAIQGRGFLQVQQNDETYYTRDGRMLINEDGDLLHVTGGRILDDGGSPITVSDQGPISIDEVGQITQGEQTIATLGVMDLPSTKDIQKAGQSLFSYNNQDNPPVEVEHAIRQGFLESSNVNAVKEMTRMIQVNRHFEIMNRAVTAYRDMDQRSIQDVGAISR